MKTYNSLFPLKRKKSVCNEWNIKNASVSCLIENLKKLHVKTGSYLKEVLFPWTCQSPSLFIGSFTERL